MVDFAHLHIHNEYSQLDGYGTAEHYTEKAKLIGQRHLGLTNHGNIDGLIKFQRACDNHSIKPVLGCELYLIPELHKDSRVTGHATVWVRNQQGFKNLCKLLTFANTTGFYYRPRVTFDMLLENCKGLVVATACLQSFLNLEQGVSLFENLYDAIGRRNLYLEIMPHLIPGQAKLNSLCQKVAGASLCSIIATNDCHYPNRGDYRVQEVLLAIQRKVKWNNPERWTMSHMALHLRTAKEMRRALEKQGYYDKSYLHNTIKLAERCTDFRIEQHDIELPRVSGIKEKDEAQVLKDLCMDGYLQRFGSSIKESRKYYRHFVEEYNLITGKDFVRYFLIVHELVDWCKHNNVLVGPGRGSVGGSLIAYLLGITAVDPIRHGLLFSRFINEDRIDLPDIDIDFEHHKRHLVRKHLEDTYGEHNVASVSSFNRMKARAVIRDVGRVFEVPYKDVDHFAKFIDDTAEGSAIEDAIDNIEYCAEFEQAYPDVVWLALKLEGQVRGYGRHAAALVVSKVPIGSDGRCNLIERDGVASVNWEKEDTEFVGLMKLDALGLNLLSTLAETKRLIVESHDHNVDLNRINLDDKEVLQEIQNGNTVGLFQLNTWAMTALIKQMGKLTFRQICDATALVRPGPSASGMTDEYIRRKKGKDWEPRHKVYEKITKDTYGLIVYQEQVMDVVHKVAGLPYSTADNIRKIIGKKRDVTEFEKFRKTFIDACAQHKVFSKREAVEFWEGLQEWARYGFNLSHATEYALLGYWCAWLKKYFPTEFISASLTYGAKDKKAALVEEAYRLGLTLVLPKVGISDPIRWTAKSNKLHIPFIEVKGIGDKKAYEAVHVRPAIKRRTRFFKKSDARPSRKHKGAFGELLQEIGAYDMEQTAQLTERVKDLFDFRIVTNPKVNYERLYTLFSNSIRLDRLDHILTGDYKLLSNLSDNRRIIKPVEFVEFEEYDLMTCTECALHKECTRPVMPSAGVYSMMIIGEAPGRDEDTEGKGFVGKAGQLLWRTLKKYGLQRELFHITNVNKCWPSESRKPNAEQIKLCSSMFLNEELNEVRPRLILAFGNTSLTYFTGRTSGILDMSGSTTWNEEIGAWIAWAVHPAAVLHNPDNETYFKAGVKNFAKTVRALAPEIKEIRE